MSRANPTRLSSLKGRVKNIKKIINITPWRLKIQRCSEDAELHQVKPTRSQPDTVDQPVRTAHATVHHNNGIDYCNNNNNNKHDNVYGAVIMAEPLREFTRFI